MTPLEARITLARNHQLVARHVHRDHALEAAATKLMDVALDHWSRQRRFRLVEPVEFQAPTPN